MGILLPYALVEGMPDVQTNFETVSAVAASALKTGTATLTAGSVTVPAPGTTANTIVRAFAQTLGGTPGALYVSAKTPGTGFTIHSTSGSDTSTVFYEIVAW